MKRTLIIIALLLQSYFAVAQHIVSREDTQYQFFPQCCNFPDWTYDLAYCHQTECFIPFHYTDHPLQIYGIAILLQREVSGLHPVDMMLCQKYRDGSTCRIVTHDSVRIEEQEVHESFRHRKRMILNSFNYRGITDQGWQIEPTFDTFSLLDFYFPLPITIEDTFSAGFKVSTYCGDIYRTFLEYSFIANCSCWDVQKGLYYLGFSDNEWGLDDDLPYYNYYNCIIIIKCKST